MHDYSSREQAIGFVNFDSAPGGANNEIEVRIPFQKINQIFRGKYVIIETGKESKFYLARISKGPFYTPDAVSRDSAFAKTAILQAEKIAFLPDYHGICFAELIGIFDIHSSHVRSIQTRPRPKSAIFPLPPEKMEDLLQLHGNMYLGQLTGYEDIRVHLDSNKKSIIPRNLGIFGTVGSGKTNSSQVLIEELSAAGWAVIVLDVEGEYISMDQPSQEILQNKEFQRIAEQFNITARGLDNFQVYFPSMTETKRKDALEFCVPFGGLSPYELSAIMEMNPAQEDRFIRLWDDLKESIYKSHKDRRQKAKVNQWKALEEGEFFDDDEYVDITLKDMLKSLNNTLENTKGADKSSWLVVKRLLGRLKRFQIFDTTEDYLEAEELIKPGKVSVIDLSNSYNVRVNNIVIAYLLRKVFSLKIQDDRLPPTMIVIEEAHTFVSRENAKKMEALLDRLREVARRGRKRWLGLCFISQQPSHLPDEIYELCNTKIIHQTTGSHNLKALKVSAGSVNESTWNDVPILGAGRSIIVSPQFQHPIMTNMRLCSTDRKHTD
jgi:uncharacterized protein